METTTDMMKNGGEQTFDKIRHDDREQLKEKLKESFPVDKQLLNCIEHLGKTFVQQFLMNSYLLSCINEQKPEDETSSEDSDGEESQSQQEFVDENGINRFLSVMVVEKVDERKKKKKGSKQTVKYKVVNAANIAEHVSNIDLKSKYDMFDDICKDATDNRVNMGGYQYKHAINMLRSWVITVHWVNKGLTGGDAITMKACTKEELNQFALKIQEYLKPMTKFGGSVAVRDFLQCKNVPDKLDNLFKVV